MIETSVVDVAAAVEAEFDRLKIARPALLSRIRRAENILVTHLSCPEAGVIRPRIRGGELVAYLVKGSGGAVYRVESGTFSCSCPDYHRRGKGCKHGIACYALGRAFRPGGAPPHDGPRHHRCGPRPGFAPKRLRQRHDVAGGLRRLRDEKAGDFASDFEHAGDVAARVLEGIAESTRQPLADCAGCGRRFPRRELIEVGDDNLTFFEGDLLCRHRCAGYSGVL